MTTRIPALGAVFLLVAAIQQAHASALSLGEKAALQAAMQLHIERRSVDGRFPLLDAAAGEVQLLRQRAAHPVILRMGEYFILCSDFEAPGGAGVNVDFFLARRDGGYVVFAQQAENHGLVQRLVKAGKAERVD